jgi:hypothetical protein
VRATEAELRAARVEGELVAAYRQVELLERLLALERVERRDLMERIQRPDVPPAPDGEPPVMRKLHYNEDDELAGLTVAEVAADAGLSVAHRYAVAHVDEIARTEGTP